MTIKRVLSIDGGGIRGIIPALVLAEIEKRTGKKIADCFDLIAGTSTGGILALGLSIGKEAKKLVDIYKRDGRKIFNRSLWKKFSSGWGVADEKYDDKGLVEVLEDHFSGKTLNACKIKTLTTSYDIQERKPVFFKSWKESHKEVKIRDVARATSAAPTYFEPAKVEVGSEYKALIDGGVFVNSPSVSAFAEAKRLWREDEIFVLSLGTGVLNRRIEYDEAKNWGKIGWVRPLIGCMMDGMADAADYQMGKILGEDSYKRLQIELTVGNDDLDDATQSNIHNLETLAKELICKSDDEIGKFCFSVSQKH